jgi:hypothetical protein
MTVDVGTFSHFVFFGNTYDCGLERLEHGEERSI